MKWRDVLIGSISTLIVTILSGVVVYYITKEPKLQQTDKLVYSIENSASFDSQKNTLALANVIVENKGESAAENVFGSIKFKSGQIKDKKIENSSGNASGMTVVTETPQNIDFKIARLLPKEKLSISFLIESASSINPEISIKSNGSVGEKEVPLENNEKRKKLIELLSAFVPLFFGLCVALVMLVFAKYKVRNKISRGSCINDTAFVLLHKGLADIGADILRNAVVEGKGGSHSIANYSTCLASKGEFDTSTKYLAAAEFLSSSSHEKAVCLFNRALILLMKGDTKGAHGALAEAIGLSKKEIEYYCQNSELFSSLAENAPEVRMLIAQKEA